MATVEIELSDATAKAAHDAGLLTSQALERLLNDALKLRLDIQKGIDSGPAIPASQLFDTLHRRIDEIEQENNAQ